MEFKGTSVYEKSNEYAKSKCSEEIGSKFIPETDLTVYEACEMDFREGYNQALEDTKYKEMLEFIQSIVTDYENGLIEDVEDIVIRAQQLIKEATEL